MKTKNDDRLVLMIVRYFTIIIVEVSTLAKLTRGSKMESTIRKFSMRM